MISFVRFPLFPLFPLVEECIPAIIEPEVEVRFFGLGGNFGGNLVGFSGGKIGGI